MTRDESRFSPEVGSLYSYVEVDRWTVTPTHCTYRQWGGITSSFGWGFTGYCTLQYWTDGVWHDAASEVSKYYSGYGDEEYDYIPEDSFVRTDVDRTVSLGNYAHAYVNGTSTSARAWIDFTVPHLPNEPTNLTASYDAVNSPNKITLSWTSPTRSCDNLRVEVQIDGGSWGEVATISSSATSYAYTSVADDHSYKFRMRAFYQNAYSSPTSETTAITTKPTAPQSLTTSATTGTTVTVNLVNASPVATGLKYQLSATTDFTGATSTTVSGSPVTSFSVDMTTNKYIRVCNTNATGDSAWLTSGEIVTVTKPNKPTLTSNMNGGTWDISKSLTLTVGYSSADGSAQQYYKYSYQIKPSGGSWGNTTSSANIAKAADSGTSWTLDMGEADDFSLSVGDSIRFEVSVKGASATWSDYSAWCELTVKQKPTINITSPDTNTPVTAMPLSISANYYDNSGTCAAASYYLTGNGKRYPQTDTLPMEVTTSGGSTTLSASISASDFIFDNGESYTVYVTARSSSSLQYTANATFQTAFVPPKAGDLQISNDPDTGYVSLLAQVADDEQAQGESVRFKWNQLVNLADNTWSQAGLTITASGGVATVTGTRNSTSWAAVYPCPVVAHKYYIRADGITVGADSYYDFVMILRNYVSSANYKLYANAPALIFDNTGGSYQYVRFNAGENNNNVKVNMTFRPLVYDLTAIYGAGNEPATVAAFEASPEYAAMQAQGKLYDYDAGSMQSTPLPLDTSEGDYLHAVEIQGAAQRFAPTFTDYSGNTNQQYDSTAGSVGRLTVQGQSAKWNMLNSLSAFTSNASGFIEENSNKLTTSSVASHIHYLGYTVVNACVSNNRIYQRNAADTANSGIVYIPSTSIGHQSVLFTTVSNSRIWLYGTATSTGYSAVTTFANNIVLVDLTALYGAGNEPTAAAFEATDVYKAKLAAGELYDYDAGSLVSIGSVGVSGRNLATLNGIARAASGLTWTANGSEVSVANTSSADWAATNVVYIPAKPNTEYTVSLSAKPSEIFNGFYASFWEVDESKSNVVETLFATWATQHDVTAKTFTTPSNVAYFKVTFGARYSGTATNKTFTVMLEQGSTAHDYEPYSLQVVFGENLVNPAAGNIVNAYIDNQGVFKESTNDRAIVIAVEPNTTYTFYGKKIDTDGTDDWNGGEYSAFPTANAQGTYIMANSRTVEYQKTFTTSATAAYICVKYANVNKTDADATLATLQLNKGKTLKPYTPYNANYAPLRSAGSVHDVLMADDDSYTVRRNVGAVDLGTLTWSLASSTYGRWYTNITDAKAPTTGSGLFNAIAANYTIVTSNAFNNVAGTMYITPNGTAVNICTGSTSEQPTGYLFYELATPTQDAETSISTLTIGSAFTVGTELDSTFTMKATADLFDPYVLTTTGTGTVSGGTITHQAISLTTSGETYADVLYGKWLAGIGDVKDTASIGATTTIERRIGCVDLGGLTWTLSGYTNIYQATISDIYVPADPSERLDGLACSMYEIDTVQPVNDTMHDMTMKRAWGMVIIRDSRYVNNAAAFKTAMSGVLLYYELATPTTESVTGTEYGELNVPDWLTLNAYQDSPITAYYGNGIEDVESISVARVNADGSITPLLEDGSAGAGIVDKYAPLNTPYEYAVTTMSSAHAVNTVNVENIITTRNQFAYWVDKKREDCIAYSPYTKGGDSFTMKSPNKKRIHYSGRKFAVSYDDGAVDYDMTCTFVVFDIEQAELFEKLMMDGARGVVKTLHGKVFHADFEVAHLDDNGKYYHALETFKAYRIDGEKL